MTQTTPIRDIQRRLNAIGYNLDVDGYMGVKTMAALNDVITRVANADPVSKAREYIVPSHWMPTAKMTKIIFHWTAGGPKASDLDKEHYHIMIEDDGKLVRGDHSIDDNVNTADDDYAAHTRACNTNAIGVAVCGMLDAKERPFDPGPHPFTPEQWDTLAHVLADLCIAYGIQVTDRTVLSHAEVQPNLGIAQRGKWDIAILPFNPQVNTAKACGDLLRNKVIKCLV